MAVGGHGNLSPPQLIVFEHWDELSLAPVAPVILHVVSWILEYLEIPGA